MHGRQSWALKRLGTPSSSPIRPLGATLWTHLRPTASWCGGLALQSGGRLSKNVADGAIRRRKGGLGEAAGRERRAAISGLQSLGRRSEERDEPGVSLVEGSPRRLAEGMEEGRGRLRELCGAMLGIHGEDRLDSEHWQAGLAPPKGRGLLDGLHQGGDSLPVVIRGQMRPTGDWREDDRLFRREPQRLEGQALVAGGVLPRPLEPVAGQGLAVEQGSTGLHARPISHPLHQVLLDSVRQNVGEALDLRSLFLGDDGHVVAALEDVALPAGQAVDLAGELGLDVAHEAGDLLGVLNHSEDVEVRRERGDGTEGKVVVSLASSEDAEDEVVERRARAEEEASLDGAAGDEDESSRGG